MTDPKITPSSNQDQIFEEDRRLIDALRYSTEHSVQVTPEFIDDLTKDVRKALVEQERPDLAEGLKGHRPPSATPAPKL